MKQRKIVRNATWTAIALTAGLAAACSGPIQMTSAKKPARTGQGGPEPVVEQVSRPAEHYSAPGARAQLREQAMGVLVAAAEGQSPFGPQERANAIEALRISPGRLATALPRALADESPAVRAVAAMTIGKAQLVAHVPLVEPLTSDPSPFVRSSAVYALKRCRRYADLTLLADLLASPVPQERGQAAFILGELGERSAVAMLREAAKDVIRKAAPGAQRLVDLQVAEARVKLGDDAALAEIRAALFPARPEDLEGTALAAQILGEVQDRGSVDRLIYLTAAQDERKQGMPAEVRLAAAGSLAKLDQRQGSFIAHEYRTSDQFTLRAQAAIVFGETGQTDNLVVLESMLADPVAQVRVAAAAAIVRITDSGGS